MIEQSAVNSNHSIQLSRIIDAKKITLIGVIIAIFIFFTIFVLLVYNGLGTNGNRPLRYSLQTLCQIIQLENQSYSTAQTIHLIL